MMQALRHRGGRGGLGPPTFLLSKKIKSLSFFSMNKEVGTLFLFEYRKEMLLFHLSQKPYNDQQHSCPGHVLKHFGKEFEQTQNLTV